MDWCGSSTPRTPEYRTMNKEKRHERKAYSYWLGHQILCPSIPWIDREGGQSFWFFHVVKQLNNENRWRMPDRIDQVMMPQLHTSLHFHLTPIVMINGSSCRDLILDSQYFCHSIPAGAENPSLSRLCYRGLWGSRNRRALILGWAYYLDAFSRKAQSQSQGTVKLHRVFLSSAVAPGTRTLARGIFSTPSYPEKSRSPCVLEPITIFRLT
ncbi:unnamed protein product [Spirodela intermedia]|uniref:Uncharacterized protein n=1 Tax=Spirodela intermedia TaxID=51605 RepID=A0ABN7ED62_SPIIN|nr:unnamed protein product [Spirodela intermedia]